MTEQEEQELKELRATIDSSSFATAGYSKRVEKPWGYEIHFTPEGIDYTGKFIHIEEAKQLSLQVHDKKQESMWLVDGEVILIVEDESGEMQEVNMEPGKGYTIAIGQKHRMKGGRGGGSVIEASTPEKGTTYRLEDDYARPSETEVMRQDPNRGWDG